MTTTGNRRRTAAQHSVTDRNLLLRHDVEQLDAARQAVQTVRIRIEHESTEVATLADERDAIVLPFPPVTAAHTRLLLVGELCAVTAIATLVAGLVLYHGEGPLHAVVSGAVSGLFAGAAAFAAGCAAMAAFPTSLVLGGSWRLLARAAFVALVVLSGLQVLLACRHWAIATVVALGVAFGGLLWAARMHPSHQRRLELDADIEEAEQRIGQLRVDELDKAQAAEAAATVLRNREVELSHRSLG